MAPAAQGTVWLFSHWQGILPLMRIPLKAALLTLLVSMFAFALVAAQSPSAAAPEYTDDGQMKLPENYRQWVYLTTGFDMSYNPGQMSMDHHMFDNVFVNPEAYQSFLQNGMWLTALLGLDRSAIRRTVARSEEIALADVSTS